MITNIDIIDFCKEKRIPLVACVTKDQLKHVRRQDGGYVVNLQDDKNSKGRDLGGTHWVALYVDGKKSAYHDPFGLPPPMEVRDFVKGLPLVYNDNQVQNENSGICGYYCISVNHWMFALRRKIPDLHKRFKWYISHFDKRPEKNRKILQNLIDPI